MPLGQAVKEAGLLLLEGRHVVLELDGGGRWRLDMPRGGAKLIGQRVQVEATRAGYDLLDVNWIGRPGEGRPRRGWAPPDLPYIVEFAVVALLIVWSLL